MRKENTFINWNLNDGNYLLKLIQSNARKQIILFKIFSLIN